MGHTTQLMRDARERGERLTFQESLDRTAPVAENIQTVTNSDLKNRFYITIDKIKNIMNSKTNKDIIHENSSSRLSNLVIVFIVIVASMLMLKSGIDYGGFDAIAFMLVVFILFVFEKAICGKIDKTILPIAIFTFLMCFVPFIQVVSSSFVDEAYLIMNVIGLISIFALSIIAKIMIKRTEYGTTMLGKVKGFKNFLETAKKDELEAMVQKNPQYYYNILPYTYALGVSDIWMSQFEDMTLEPPTWYDCHGRPFHTGHFNHFVDDTMHESQRVMTSRPHESSSSGGGFSSSSGGGISGGGSGGGGGHSW